MPTLARRSASACSIVYVCSRNGTTFSSGSTMRSFTLSSPFQLSRCVLRSTNTIFGSPDPYLKRADRQRRSSLPGCRLRSASVRAR